jgi:hypothetical protein
MQKKSTIENEMNEFNEDKIEDTIILSLPKGDSNIEVEDICSYCFSFFDIALLYENKEYKKEYTCKHHFAYVMSILREGIRFSQDPLLLTYHLTFSNGDRLCEFSSREIHERMKK